MVFDVDGTLLDSAPGIVAGFVHALQAIGLPAPDEAAIRSDLGPPAPVLLGRLGVPADLVPAAYAAYRQHYLAHGLDRATVYPGIRTMLAALTGRVRLATATAKLTGTAELILARHRLADPFEVIGGSTDGNQAKEVVLAATLARLGDPDPAGVIMVGDRHSDLTAAAAHGLRSVGVSWGYGSRAELQSAAPDHLIDHPDHLLALL